MITADCHLHTSFSGDSVAPMESMIQSALARGLKTMCFTEHLDYDYPAQEDGIDFLLDTDAYRQCFLKLRDRYASDIELRFGIEIGMMPYLAPRCQALIDSEPFDFVIMSTHLVDGLDPYDPIFFEGKTEFEAYSGYFQTIPENIAAFKNFDTYGHIDYVVRYGPNQNRNYTYEKYEAFLRPALRAIIDSGKALEVNTGGFREGLGQPHPQMDVLRAFKAMGGELITIGSDAHDPRHIAFGFKETEDILQDLGFRYYAVYKNRKPQMVKL